MPIEKSEYFGFVLQMLQPKRKMVQQNNKRLLCYQEHSKPSSRGRRRRAWFWETSMMDAKMAEADGYRESHNFVRRRHQITATRRPNQLWK
jgi:hypothetical protein